MFCHLIPDEKFTNKVIDFMMEEYEKGSNKFIVYNEGRNFDIKDNNEYVLKINSIEDNNKSIIELLKEADKIFIHGFGAKQIVDFFVRHKAFLKKAVVIIWGGDLYNDHLFLEENRGICLRLRYFIYKKKKIIKRVPAFMTFTCTDYDRAHEWLGANGYRFDCLYPSNLDAEQLINIEKGIKEKKYDNEINILIGNSATTTNNHFEVFEKIKRFKDENIKIYCPLSYGNSEYGKQVEKEGQRIFGEKFIAIKKYMEIEEYAKFLASMDVAFFAYNRQQATANLEILGYFGVKVFLKKGFPLWSHYVDRDNCSFYDLGDIDNSSFEEMVKMEDCQKINNRVYFSKIWDDKYIKSLWDAVMYYDKKN